MAQYVEEETAQPGMPPHNLSSEESVNTAPADEPDSGDEWDTDLETNETGRRSRTVSSAELYLQACQLVGVVPVSYFLRHLGTTTLDLNHHGLGPLGGKALAIALVTDLQMTTLALEDNFLLAEGTQYLMEMLRENITIQKLNLSHNHLQSAGADSISKMLLDNVSIKSLKLSGNEFIDEAAKSFADALANNYRVKELDLSRNQFCEVGGEYLGQMLANNEGLETLNLSWNHLRMNGAVALCAGLKVNVTLKQLDLSWNGFGNEGALALGEALRYNNTLVFLDLSSNRVTDEAMSLLCHGLAANDTLRVLRLAYNPLTEEGALRMITAVKNNLKSALEEINISNVLVSKAFVELLDDARQDHPGLEVQYQGVTGFITRSRKAPDALKVIQDFLEEHKQSLTDFFQSMDQEGTMRIPIADFKKAVKEANIPLDLYQIEGLIQKLDTERTGMVDYSFVEQAQA